MLCRHLRCTIAALALLLSACSTFPQALRPEIQNMHPRIAGLDLQGINLAFDFDVANPWPIPIRAPKFQYALAVQNSPFLSQTVSSGIDIPANGNGKASLPVRLSYSDLLRTFQTLRTANQATYQLSGALLPSVAGQEFQLPFSHAGTVPILQLPKISIVDLKTTGGSFGQMTLDLAADIENPNVFDVGVGALTYALKMGGTEVGKVTASTDKTVPAGETGRINLAAQGTGLSMLQGLLDRGQRRQLTLTPTSGSIQTPYGPIRLR